ncbi:MFS transporter [Nonomuraea dietziae]|uniref:MFS transporter n=1 Tax=Nonomuraea dietziae TaxID=65515 RepID=UPI0031DFE0B6
MPAYWAFAVGFVLWGAREALESGALEALVYDHLDHDGAAEEYAKVMGRARSVGLVAVALSMAVAGPVFAGGGYTVVGVASVLACLACALVALTFTERRAAAHDEDPTGYLDTLRAGLAEARTSPKVRSALLLVPAVTAIWGELEEYVPLLARESGAATTAVPLLVLLVWVGATSGGLLATYGSRMRARGFAAVLAVGGLALSLGAITGHPAGFAGIAVAFAMFQLGGVLADARLQERITGPSRATVTSLAGPGHRPVHHPRPPRVRRGVARAAAQRAVRPVRRAVPGDRAGAVEKRAPAPTARGGSGTCRSDPVSVPRIGLSEALATAL